MSRIPDAIVEAAQKWAETRGAPPCPPGDPGSRQWVDALLREAVWPLVDEARRKEPKGT